MRTPGKAFRYQVRDGDAKWREPVGEEESSLCLRILAAYEGPARQYLKGPSLCVTRVQRSQEFLIRRLWGRGWSGWMRASL